MPEPCWTLAAIAAALGLPAAPDRPVRGLVTDSRTVAAGDVFVALRGERFDGHAFAAAAAAQGAVGVIVDRPVEVPPSCQVFAVADTLRAYGELAAAWRARWPVQVLAVTGSTGKSSTRELLATVLRQRYEVLAAEKSYNNEVGVPATLLRLGPEHELAVLELAMRGPGEIDYLARLAKPGVGVITNLGMSHLERLGSREAIARAKGELLDHLGPDGVAVLNHETPGLAEQAPRHSGRTLWFGFDEAADVRAVEVTLRGLSGSRFRLRTPGGESLVELGLPGRHMVANALAAAAAATAVGLPVEVVARGLAAARTLPLRLEVVALGDDRRVINDAYNAAPDSVRAALQVMASEPCERRVVCLGDMLEMGAVAAAEHLRLGPEVAAVADLVIGVGELGGLIADGARDAGHAQTWQVADAAEAGRLLATLTRPGDLILLKASRAVGLDSILGDLEAGA